LRIGVISDTHGLLRPQAVERLRGVEHILHAGDIGRPEVIEELERLAPVTAVRGNIDVGAWAERFPERAVAVCDGRGIYLLHDLKALELDPAAEGYAVVVSGHSHRPRVETLGGVLYLNPGSAGPRRFTLPVALAVLELGAEDVRAEVLEILP
jgi:putative phosphoesterase